MAAVKTEGEISIGFWDKSKVNELRDFYRVVYSPRHILLNEKYFNWYAGKNSKIIVAKSEGKIIGHWLCLERVFNNHGKTTIMWWVSNWAVHPDLRYRALGGFMVKFLLEQPIDVLAANMVTPEARRVMEHFGFSHYLLDRYLAILSPEVKQIVVNPDDARIKERIDAALISIPKGLPLNMTRVTSEFGSDYDRFWQGIFAPQVLGTARTAEFLAWRYLKEPFLPYESFLVHDGENTVRGLIVLRIEPIVNTKVTACRLLEFFTSEGWGEKGLNYVLSYAQQKNCAFLDFYNTFSGFDAVFKKAGILKNDPVLTDEIPRLTQPIAHENYLINLMTRSNSNLGKVGEWYTTSGDADQDRKNFS